MNQHETLSVLEPPQPFPVASTQFGRRLCQIQRRADRMSVGGDALEHGGPVRGRPGRQTLETDAAEEVRVFSHQAAVAHKGMQSFRQRDDSSVRAYAKLCGGKGIRVTTADTLLPALEEALAHEGPALVEIITDADLI